MNLFTTDRDELLEIVAEGRDHHEYLRDAVPLDDNLNKNAPNAGTDLRIAGVASAQAQVLAHHLRAALADAALERRRANEALSLLEDVWGFLSALTLLYTPQPEAKPWPNDADASEAP